MRGTARRWKPAFFFAIFTTKKRGNARRVALYNVRYYLVLAAA